MTAVPPTAEQPRHQLHGGLQPDRLEGVVDAAGHDRPHLTGHVVGVAAHRVRRADIDRLLELGVLDVDRDDRMRACQHRAHHHRQPDAAAPDHADGGAGLDLGGVDHGANAGRDAAADQAGDVERKLGRDRQWPPQRARPPPRRTSPPTGTGRPRRRRRAGTAASRRPACSRPSACWCMPTPYRGRMRGNGRRHSATTARRGRRPTARSRRGRSPRRCLRPRGRARAAAAPSTLRRCSADRE